MVDFLNKCFENCTFSVKWSSPAKTNTSDGDHLYRASFESIPLSKGRNMLAFKGKAYSAEDICAKSVVVKGIKDFSGNSQDFKMYELCMETGRNMANKFNKILGSQYIKIRFVVPALTTINERAVVTKLLQYKTFERDEAVVFEERLKGKFRTFVGKRGESSSIEDTLILEAFCHFTYVASNKEFVICGLKGVRSKDMSKYALTNPTIHSKEGKFGPRDKRDPGIKDFWDNHTCNAFCRVFMNEEHFGES